MGPSAAQARPRDVKVVVVAAVRALILTKGFVYEIQARCEAQRRDAVQPAVSAQFSLVVLEPLHSRRQEEVELEEAPFSVQLVAKVCHRFS